MRIAPKFVASLFALAVMVGFSGAANAADAEKKEKGTIAGVVKGPDGKEVSGATVRLMAAADAPAKKAEKAPAPALADKPAAGEKKPGRGAPALMEATTDDKGAFTMKDVPAGDYTVRAVLKGTGNGNAKVTVKGGDEAKVEISLKAPKQK